MFLTRNIKIINYRGSDPFKYFVENSQNYHGIRRDTVFTVIRLNNEAEYQHIMDRLNEKKYIIFNDITNSLENISDCTEIYNRWNAVRNSSSEILMGINFPYCFNSDMFDITLRRAFSSVMDIYEVQKGITPTMAKNLGIKLLCWITIYFRDIFKGGYSFPKIVYDGKAKLHQVLFLLLLHFMGCDILYMDRYNCIDEIKDYVNISKKNVQALLDCLPETNKSEESADGSSQNMPVLSDAAKNSRTAAAETAAGIAGEGKELSYEELAALSEAVVMIQVLDNGKPVKTGSGIVIGSDGYILTNYHVVNGGQSYSIMFENDDEKYYTDELIKCHSFNDLALLRVCRRCRSLEIVRNRKIVRGQQVVAIGSPLGLFNTVSNGIVSGFRMINDVDMIQFTAPISHGSSGGALLNMYGEVVGIITAGFDDGQNLNLAVHSDLIKMFAKSFFK